MEKKDLVDYEVKIRQPLETSIGKWTLVVPPLPSSGGKLVAILNILKGG